MSRSRTHHVGLCAALALGCGDNVLAPCAIEETPGAITVVCGDDSASWAVPWCGNDVREAGEDCDDLTRACTATCTARPGVACTADDAVCLCDPRRYPEVPSVDAAIGYGTWIDLDEQPPQGHPFTGAGGDPGPEFATRGELAFGCDLATGAPAITIAALRRRAVIATAAALLTPDQVAAVPTTAPTLPSVLRPSEWLGHALVVTTERGRSYAVEVPFYESPCLGTADDTNLLIEYLARGLWCPRAL